MAVVTRIFTSSVGRKLIMGLTGLVLALFVLVHMAGNLQVFAGADVLNHYAVLLRTSEELLWLARIVLLVCAVVHISLAIQLSVENRKARPVSYNQKQSLGATIASRSMGISGLVLALFIVFHIMHFTTHDIFPEYAEAAFTTDLDGKTVHDVYGMVKHGFSQTWVVVVYVIGVALLGLHLSHGFQSLFHSTGFMTKEYDLWMRRGGFAVALIIFAGMIVVPLAVYFNLLPQ